MKQFVPDNLKKYINEVENKPYYKSIKRVVQIFEDSGLIFRSQGHCIGTSDLVRRLLLDSDIESSIVECSLSVLDRDPINKINFVGYDTNKSKNHSHEVETHVICITKTEIPILIDLTVQTTKTKYIVFPLFDELVTNRENILTLDFGHSLWIYNKREMTSLPGLHEKSIIERIQTDYKVQSQINILKKIVIFIAVMSSLNFLRGSYDHYQKYINKTNGFGPNKILVDKIEKNEYK
jgi:hypothetical protein